MKKLIGILFLALIICLILAMVSVVNPAFGIPPVKYLGFAMVLSLLIDIFNGRRKVK